MRLWLIHFGFCVAAANLAMAAGGVEAVTTPPPKLFNQGNAAYREKKFDEAAKAYQQALTAKDQTLQQRDFYNLGNACYRLGQPLEATQPERAQEMYKQAVSCYSSALSLNPKDEDAAFNKQFVEVLLKKLEQQQQQQQQNQQNQQQQKQDQQKQNQQQQQQEQQAQQQQQQQKQDQQKQRQEAQQQQQQQKQQQKPDQKPGEDNEPKDPHEMSEMEAKLLLDAQREEEKNWKDKPQRSLRQREPEKNW